MRYAYCVLNNKVMIMKKIIVSFLVVAGITAANIGIASDYPAVKSSGLYVDGNIGYGMVRVKNSGYPSSDFNGFAWNFSLGYQFIRYVALEAGYTRFADIKVSPLLGSLETPVQGEDLLVKGIYPFCHDQFELFAKAGYTRLSKSTLAIVNGANYPRSKENGPHLWFGRWIQYYASHRLDCAMDSHAFSGQWFPCDRRVLWGYQL